MIDTSIQLKVPRSDPDFFVLNEDSKNLDRFEKMSEKHPVNILTTGNQGCGKSSMVRQFASIYNRPMATFQVGLLLESGQLFGQTRLKEGETYYREFLFPKAIQTPGCVIHLEEINRSESPHALNELFSVLSEDRSIWIDELGFVEVAPKVMFFATMNEGDEFTGTDTLDAALKDRFYRIHLEYLPPDVEREVLIRKTGIGETEAKKVLKIVNRIRNNDQLQISVSIRHSLMIAELVSLGASLREALVYSLQISKDTLESLLLSVHVETSETEVERGKYVLYLPDE
ncbi:MAG: CbbQ/NirQ/NorQ/GpvN family protein [Proteobacteria bacterium]|nr:CbbQ/NirQ/NorQ/GpvN family protein [Pseudomonadota bacterium]